MTVIHNQPIEALVSVGKYENLIDPAGLPAHQQRQIWEGIKSMAPDLAEMLRNDQNMAGLKLAFGASVQFTEVEINQFTQAGLKNIQDKTK